MRDCGERGEAKTFGSGPSIDFETSSSEIASRGRTSCT
jgi:hypothetical protein